MGTLTNIIAAEEDEVEAIGESVQPVDEWSGLTLRDVGIAKVATLHCLLTGDLFDDAVTLYEPIYTSPVEGAQVLRVADSLMERLTGIDEDMLQAVASELVATEEFESAKWEEESIFDMLTGLADLARLADSQGQVLFVWLHPLRT